MKPGIKTTEFWLTFLQALIGPVVLMLVATGVLSPEADPTAITESVSAQSDAIVQSVLAIVGTIGSVLAVKGYTAERTKAKTTTTPTP